MITNVIRRKIVNYLLGDELILQETKTPYGYKVELIDEKRRLNYGQWNCKKINRRDFKLSR